MRPFERQMKEPDGFIRGSWSILPEAGVALHFGLHDSGWPGYRPLYAEPDLGIGARLHFTGRNALLMRIGTPGGVQVGLTF
jgi:hypothetical protein